MSRKTQSSPCRLHLRIYGARNDIAKGQIFQRMIFLHESPPTPVDAVFPLRRGPLRRSGSFSPSDDRGRWDEIARIPGSPALPLPVGYGEPVSGGDVGIAGVEIDFPGPAGAQQHGVCHKGVDLLCGCIKDVCAPAYVLLVQVKRTGFHGMMLDYQIQHHVVFENDDIRVGFGGVHQDFFNSLCPSCPAREESGFGCAPLLFPDRMNSLSAHG